MKFWTEKIVTESIKLWNNKTYDSLWGETPIQISNDNWKNGSYFSHTFFFLYIISWFFNTNFFVLCFNLSHRVICFQFESLSNQMSALQKWNSHSICSVFPSVCFFMAWWHTKVLAHTKDQDEKLWFSGFWSFFLTRNLY